MKPMVISREYFRAMPTKQAEDVFNRINSNPANVYQPGYEFFLNWVPIINGEHDPLKEDKLKEIAGIIEDLGDRLLDEQRYPTGAWINENWPAKGQMLGRSILAIDETTGAELVLVRWNEWRETPIHGHAHGQMIDYLLKGRAKEIEYDVYDFKHRKVHERGFSEHKARTVLSNDFYRETDLSRSSLIHKFIAITKCITLHIIPEHPRDGRGNLFNEPKL